MCHVTKVTGDCRINAPWSRWAFVAVPLTSYDVAEFVQALRQQKITPHVAAKEKSNAIDARTTRHAGYKVSIRKRKLVEEVFGWAKCVGQLHKALVRGLEKIKALTLFNFVAYNLTRMATIFGWRLSNA